MGEGLDDEVEGAGGGVAEPVEEAAAVQGEEDAVAENGGEPAEQRGGAAVAPGGERCPGGDAGGEADTELGRDEDGKEVAGGERERLAHVAAEARAPHQDGDGQEELAERIVGPHKGVHLLETAEGEQDPAGGAAEREAVEDVAGEEDAGDVEEREPGPVGALEEAVAGAPDPDGRQQEQGAVGELELAVERGVELEEVAGALEEVGGFAEADAGVVDARCPCRRSRARRGGRSASRSAPRLTETWHPAEQLAFGLRLRGAGPGAARGGGDRSRGARCVGGCGTGARG